jgi:hypothetical protein
MMVVAISPMSRSFSTATTLPEALPAANQALISATAVITTTAAAASARNCEESIGSPEFSAGLCLRRQMVSS